MVLYFYLVCNNSANFSKENSYNFIKCDTIVFTYNDKRFINIKVTRIFKYFESVCFSPFSFVLISFKEFYFKNKWNKNFKTREMNLKILDGKRKIFTHTC